MALNKPLLKRYLSLLEYELALVEAADDLIRFSEVTMPIERHMDDPSQSKYKPAPHHRFMASLGHRAEAGDLLKGLLRAPPRHGKSQLMTVNFAAWLSGRHPDKDIIIGSYNSKFAEDIGGQVKEVLKSRRFRQIFPDHRLDKEAVDHISTTMGGNLYFIGRDSTVTGRGGHCFPAGTMVATADGNLPIEKIFLASTPVKVLSLGHDGITEKIVQAASRRSADGIRRITFASGGVVEATAEHPFLTDRGWVQAGSLAPGDRVLRVLRNGHCEDGLRDGEVGGAGADAPLLLKQVLERWGKRAALRRTPLRGLRGEGPEINVLGRQDDILLGLLQGTGRTGAQEAEAGGDMPRLHEAVSSQGEGSAGDADILLTRLQRHCSQRAGFEQGQPEVEGRRDGAAEPLRAEVLQNDAQDRHAARSTRLRRMRPQGAAACAPHGQQPGEQRFVELGHSLHPASQPVARRRIPEGCADAVAVVEVLSGSAEVYDLEVADNHNFFANGVLVSNCLILDDPIRNDADARSSDYREKLWQWFTQTFLTRRHTDQSVVIVTGTQWHEDDLFGRLTDPTNPAYSAKLAAGFEDIRLPVFAQDDDPVGRKPGEVLWPSRFSRSYLEEMQEANSGAFSALYLCNPVPSKGAFYQTDGIFEYDAHELPSRLTMYVAADFAVATATLNDRTCMIPYGVDDRGDAWIMPRIVWERIPSDEAVERAIKIIREHQPTFWFCEKGQLIRSIGPFITKRMEEEQVYCPFITDQRTQDKVAYAHTARNRAAQGRIRFPRFAPWWPDAKTEMLKFPNARFDDFVDTLSVIGMKLNHHTGPGAALVRKDPDRGSWGALRAQFKRGDRAAAVDKARAGW